MRAASLLIAFCLWAGPAAAQPALLPYVGYNLSAGYDNGASYLARDADELDTQGGVLIGVGADFVIAWERLPFTLSVRPSVETTFVPDETADLGGGESVEISQRFWQASATLVGEVPVGAAPVVPFFGFGLTYARYAADFDTSPNAVVEGPASVNAWELAPALVAGFRFGRGRVTPLLQARYRFANPEPSFSAERPGADIDNGLSITAGARIVL